MIKSKDEVESFLKDLQKILKHSDDNIHIAGRYNKPDKTLIFMSKYGISRKMLCNFLSELIIEDYVYTDKDYDPKRIGDVWVFQKMFTELNILTYIKLKLRDKVICLSLHPPDRVESYPYKT